MGMKNILSYIPKKLAAALVVATVALGIATVAVATYGPDRPTRAWSETENGFDHVTFNSFTGVPNGIGDERDFLRGVQVGRDASWIDPVNSVEQDAEIEAKIYIHNNADPLQNTVPDGSGGFVGIAENVTVKVEIPSGIKLSHEVTAKIGASNAVPSEIFDTLSMTGANSGYFELAYVPGSAKLIDGGLTTALSDSLVSASGVALADQKGCFEFVREITFRMKVKMPHYQLFKSVRHEGQTSNDWVESIDANPGEMLEWKIEFKNIGQTALQNVIIVDDMPQGMVIESGSVKFYDGNFPSGTSLGNDVIQQDGKQLNVNIGNTNPDTNAIVFFKAKIPAASELECGGNYFVNLAYATPQGFHTLESAAVVVVEKDSCEPGTPQYSCDAVNITKLGGRKVRVDVSKTALPADRVSVKNYEYNFGDGSTALVSDKNPVEYTFVQDGTFKVSVKVSFTVDGQTKTSAQVCEAIVTFTTPSTIPNTGAGSMIGSLTAISIVGMLFHRAWTLRRINQ